MFSVLGSTQFVGNNCWLTHRLRQINFIRVNAVGVSRCTPPVNPCCPTPTCATGASGDRGSSKHQITYKRHVPPCYKDHDHKNMTLRRPMSPHLTIYAPTLPAMLSITQRGTGVVLTFYALLLSGGTLFLSNGIETYVSIIQSLDLSSSTITAIKVLIGAPFSFHYFNGMRFACWNAGKKLQLKEVYSTGKAAVVAGAALCIFFALI